MMRKEAAERAKSLGVTIEAEYTVGEYDIVILSAKQSDGLETWLAENGYRIPKGASRRPPPLCPAGHEVLRRQGEPEGAKGDRPPLSATPPVRVRVAEVHAADPSRHGERKGSQDLLLYVLTRGGRVETTNYRTVKLPTGMDVPEYVKDDFARFYKSMFDTQVKAEKMRAVFTEYFWNMGWCDPCAAEPLSHEELRKLGVFWLDDDSGRRGPDSRRRDRLRFPAARCP